MVQDDARSDVLDIAGGIAVEQFGAGMRFLEAFESTCRFLAEYPRIGTLRSPVNPALRGLAVIRRSRLSQLSHLLHATFRRRFS